MKSIFSLLLIISGLGAAAQTISAEDLKKLTGCWRGSLTYLDYGSGRPLTILANMDLTQIGNSNKFALTNAYPDEPKANSADTLTISADGSMLNDETVKSRKKLKQGKIEIVTEVKGIDGNDNKPALLRYTYEIGDNTYTLRKDVKFLDKKKWIKRHEYSYQRITPCW